MKRILYLLMAVAVLASCSKHEDFYTLPEGGTRTPITINVTDGGYTNSTPHTRAVENGYITEFTAGDKIGLYVVNPDGTYVHENVALTLTDIGGGTLAWTPPASTTLYYEGATAKYFAYYPYQQTLPAASGTPAEPVKPDASATDASGFFAPLISAWTPATDQGTHAAYTASDLMTGSGTVNKQSDGTYSLSFAMTHAMALVIIETPMTKYTFSNSSPAIPDYYVPAPDTRFHGFTPCFIDGKYRLLVKPSQSGASDLMGSYTATLADNSTVTKEYAIVQNNITAASYAHYRVDGPTVTEKSHTLQAGDFYLKDGSLLGKDETPTAEQQAACLGIVYWVGDPTNTTNGDPLLARDKSTCTHGLVVALHEAKDPLTNIVAQMNWSVKYEQVNAWTNHNDRGDNKVKITEMDRYQGYANTVALKAYNESSKVTSDADYKVLPIIAIEQYSKDYPAPSNSSGWYVPSGMELMYMCWGQGNSQSTAGRELLDGQFAKADGTNFGGSSLWDYWSSSEYDSSRAWFVYFGYGRVDFYPKDNHTWWVRAICAF